MAETSGFFEARLNEETEEYDRLYYAEQFANYFKLFIGNGIFIQDSNQLQVESVAGMNIKVNPGWGFINGYWYNNSEELNITIPVNTFTVDRYDLVVLRKDLALREISIVYLENETNIRRDGNYYDLALAKIRIPVGSASISNSNITDKRSDEEVCGFVKGLVDIITTDALFNQFTAQFNEWFTDVKEKLEEDPAGKLQAQIGNLVELVTVNKGNLVKSINEVVDKLDNLSAEDVGAVAVGSSTMAYGLTPDSLSTTIGNLGFTLDNTFEELYQILKNNYNKFENYFLLVTTSNSSVFNNSLPVKTGCTIECVNIKSASTRCTFKLYNFRNNDIYINTVIDGVLNGWVKLADINDAVASANSLNVIEIVANTNLNNLNVSGFYYSPTNANTQTLLNVPPIQTSFFMMVGKHAGIYQEITEYIPNNPKKFIRNSYNGVWGEWIEISKIIDHNLKTYTSLEQLGTNVDDITKWTGLVPLNSQLTFTVDLSKLSILYPKGLLPINSAGSIRIINTTGRGFIEYVCEHGYYYAFSDNLEAHIYDWQKIATEKEHNIKTYTDLSQIGITKGSETINAIATKMSSNSILMINVGSGHANIYPVQKGILTIEKVDDTRVSVKFQAFNKADTWLGHWATGTWSGWTKVATDNGIEFQIVDGELQYRYDTEVWR